MLLDELGLAMVYSTNAIHLVDVSTLKKLDSYDFSGLFQKYAQVVRIVKNYHYFPGMLEKKVNTYEAQ